MRSTRTRPSLEGSDGPAQPTQIPGLTTKTTILMTSGAAARQSHYRAGARTFLSAAPAKEFTTLKTPIALSPLQFPADRNGRAPASWEKRARAATSSGYWSGRLSLLALWLVLAAPAVNAGDMTEQQVRTAVQTWLRHVTAEARPEAKIETMQAYEISGRTMAYIAHLTGGGFCLCGANDLVLPVYFYCPNGVYHQGDEGCQAILCEIGLRSQALSENALAQSVQTGPARELAAERKLAWEQLISGSPAPRQQGRPKGLAPDLLELPLTCAWHQDSPYNDQCPVLTPGSGEHCMVGCAATAMAQIMYYWKWPLTGTGQTNVQYQQRVGTTWIEEPLAVDPVIPSVPLWVGRLEWTSANGGRLRMDGWWDRGVHDNAADIAPGNPAYQSALEALYSRLTPVTTRYSVDFSAASYNWALMQDEHWDPVDTGDAEVAKLCYHVAIAHQSEFCYARGTFAELWTYPLPDFFRYEPGVVGQEYPNTADLIGTLIEEIEWLRPVGITKSWPGGGSHSWVIFGYNKGNDQFKMNLGGTGGPTGWYTIDRWGVPGGYQGLLTRIAPRDVVKFVGSTSFGDGSPANPYLNIETAVNAAPDGATLIFKAGSDNTFAAATLTLSRPMTLKGSM